MTGWLQHETWEAITQRIAALHLSPAPDHPLFALPDLPGLGMLPVEDHLSNGDIEDLARAIKDSQAGVSFVRGFVDTGDPLKGPDVDELRKGILEDYALTIFAGRTTGNPPKRGDFGEAEILLKPNAVPVKLRPYPLGGTGELHGPSSLTSLWPMAKSSLVKDLGAALLFPSPKRILGNTDWWWTIGG